MGGQDGSWQIQTLWRDFAALRAVRDAGQLPSALALMERLGAPDSQTHLSSSTARATTTSEDRGSGNPNLRRVVITGERGVVRAPPERLPLSLIHI